MVQFLKNHTTGEAQSYETKNGNDIIKTVSGNPPNDEVYHYATAGVVGNGSFGVVFQATCLETSETVRTRTAARGLGARLMLLMRALAAY